MNFKITFKLNLIVLAIGLVFSTSNSNAQVESDISWTKMGDNKNATFYEVQQNFNEYWRDRTVTKGSGYKPFKRWEAFMEPRVGPEGDMTLPYTTYANYISWQAENQASPTAGNRSLTSNWTALGPVGKPATPFGQGARTGTGRVNFTKIHPTDSQKLFIGTPDGGLWRSTNGGTSWTTNTDFLGVIGCSDLVFDPTNPQIMYLATGDDEGDRRSIGVLKSIDGGNTWNPTGLTWTVQQGFRITRLIIDPANGQKMYISTNQGVFRTTDGWATNTGSAIAALNDMEMKPGDPTTLYTSGTEVYRSTDSGANWAQITSGLPNANVSRIELAVSAANGNYVYALYGRADNEGFLGLYRSTDSGANFVVRYTGPINLLGWELLGTDVDGQAFYDLEMAVSPINAEKVSVGAINQWQTSDGGTSWNMISHWFGDGGKPTVHADVHDLTYDPSNSTTLYSGNDGGIFKSTNDGTTWTDISNNLNISQIVRLGLSQIDAAKIVTGMQDNGSNYRTGTTWNNINGGDGGECLVDYSNNNTVYFSYIFSEVHRSDDGGVSENQITNGLPNGTNDLDFYSSYHQDPVTANTLYAGGHVQLYRTTNRGDNWTVLGTPQGNGNLTEFAIASSNNQIIYAVKSDVVSKSTNGGTSFTDVTSNLPTGTGSFSNVAVKNNNPNIVWVTKISYTAGEKVFKSTDGGTTWVNISGGLPNIPINTVVSVNGSATDEIYVGADIGVYYVDNTIPNFSPFLNNLPNVAVKDLEIYYPTSLLRAATYGRGVWESSLSLLGVEDDVFANGIVVYPNPVSNELTLELPNNSETFKFDIVNMNGQVVYSGSLQNKTIVDTSSFATGLYIIKMENNKTFEFKKIIKQ